ncbi:MAG: hypothetical protein GY950_18130 [bacterium]|nr:hypothetical protein [bacterium]
MKPTKNNVENFDLDLEIKKRVQAVELDVPRDLEEEFMKELAGMTPELPPKRRNLVYMGALATAATFLLAVFLLVTVFFDKTPVQVNRGVEEEEVFVDFARVEGVPANTYIVNQQDPDITIVWIEKAQLLTKNHHE